MIKRRKFIKKGSLLITGALCSPVLSFIPELKPDNICKKHNHPVNRIIGPDILEDYVRQFNQNDNELYPQTIINENALNFLKENIPLFECPDKEIERTYYFRWWTFRKHLRNTEDGWVITEFLPQIGHSGRHNTICCPGGHHFREGRWLLSDKYLIDYANFWFRKGGAPRNYSFWISDSIWNFALVSGRFDFAEELLPCMISNYLEWEKSRMDPNGLYWQIDVRDGMEVSISGSGYRATINSYQYGDAMAIYNIAMLSGRDDIAQRFQQKAFDIKNSLNKYLWDKKAGFYKVGIRVSDQDPKPASVLSWIVNDDERLTRKAIVSSSQRIAPEILERIKKDYSGKDTGKQQNENIVLYPRKGRLEWIQYDFSGQVTVNNMKIYWYQDGFNFRLPREWNAFYRKGKKWYPVPARVRNRIDANRYNVLTMDPVTTTSLRIEIRCQGNIPVVINDNIHLTNVRELHGYTPWYFEGLTDHEMAVAWKQIMDPRGFYAPFGPTTAEQRHPGFKVEYSGHACQWNGPSWPFSTSVTLTGLANLLNDNPFKYIDKIDYFKLVRNYALSHRIKKTNNEEVCWIDENQDPFTGEWLSRNMLQRWGETPVERGKDYNHSTFCDLIINGSIGLRPQIGNKLIINPLITEDQWDWFCLDGVPYHGRSVSIIWDKNGDHYGRGKGLKIMVDGYIIANSVKLQKTEVNYEFQQIIK